MEMRVKDDLCSAPGSPSHRFGITPAFVANDDTEGHVIDPKQAPLGTCGVRALFAGIELDFVLETGDRPIAIDHQSRDRGQAFDDAFGSENHGNVRVRSRCRDGGPGTFEKVRIGRRHDVAHATVTRDKALRKTDDVGVLRRCVGDRSLSKRDRLLGTCGELDVGKSDSTCAHFGFCMRKS